MKRVSIALLSRKIGVTPMVSVDLFCFTPEEFRKILADLNLTAIDPVGEGIVLSREEFIKPYKEQFEDMTARGMRKKDCMIIKG